MKKLLSAVLVLLALAVAAFFFIKLRRFLPERSRAAALAPAETVLFVQMPSVRETAFRVPGLDLYELWMEPEVQAFLEKPRRKAPWMKRWEERFDEVVRVAPGEAFVAFTALEPRPEFVGGFSYAGPRKSAEALVEKSRDLLPGPVVTRAHQNWLFFGTNAAALDALVTRYEGAASPVALAGDPAFQQAIQALGVAQDLVVYGRTNALPQLATAAPKSPVVALGTKIQKSKLHDTIFLPGPPAEGAPVKRQSITLTSPQTLLYYAGDFAHLPGREELMLARRFFPSLAALEATLAERGLGWKDLPAAFGPEVGLIIEWPEEAALPLLVVAPQVREPARATHFVEALTRPPAPQMPWTPDTRSGLTAYTAPPTGLSFLRPSLALTTSTGLAGLTPESLDLALARVQKPGPNLGSTPAFVEATRLLATEPATFAYLDFPRLFERIYRMARPFITLSMAFSPEIGAHVDAGKLPPAEAMARNLSPIIVTQSAHERGQLLESTGSMTFPQLFLALGLAGNSTGLAQLPGMGPSLLQSAPRAKGAPSGAQPPAPPPAAPKTTPALPLEPRPE